MRTILLLVVFSLMASLAWGDDDFGFPPFGFHDDGQRAETRARFRQARALERQAAAMESQSAGLQVQGYGWLYIGVPIFLGCVAIAVALYASRTTHGHS